MSVKTKAFHLPHFHMKSTKTQLIVYHSVYININNLFAPNDKYCHSYNNNRMFESKCNCWNVFYWNLYNNFFSFNSSQARTAFLSMMFIDLVVPQHYGCGVGVQIFRNLSSLLIQMMENESMKILRNVH